MAKKRKTKAAKAAPAKQDVAAALGRPTDYQPIFATIAREMCELGATDFDLAQAFEVTTVTIWRWQARHPEFCNALRQGKETADARVERALYQRAVGYTFHDEKLFCFEGTVTRADILTHVPPDVGAAKHWLANRKSKQWREQLDVNHGGDAIAKFLDLATSAAGKALGPKNPHAEAPNV